MKKVVYNVIYGFEGDNFRRFNSEEELLNEYCSDGEFHFTGFGGEMTVPTLDNKEFYTPKRECGKGGVTAIQYVSKDIDEYDLELHWFGSTKPLVPFD
jgi:hypothetical protein